MRSPMRASEMASNSGLLFCKCVANLGFFLLRLASKTQETTVEPQSTDNPDVGQTFDHQDFGNELCKCELSEVLKERGKATMSG